MRATSASQTERKHTMRTGRHFDTPAGQDAARGARGAHFAAASAQACPALARAAVCTAGLSLALTLGGAPLAPAAAQAAENVPEGVWTPDLPDINGGTTGGGESGGSGTGGESGGGSTTPDIDPGESGGTGGGGAELPADGSDTPSYVPSYDETYGGGSTSSYAASAAAFSEPGTAGSTDVAAAATDADVAAQASAPVISGWDAATRTVTGTATSGTTVRALDAQGNAVAEAQAGEDGTFSLTLPEGTTLADVTIVTVDAAGTASQAASGSQFVARQQAADRARVSAEVASTVAGLAANISSDVSSTGVGTGYAQPASSALPLMPYVLGAAAGVVGAGAAVAGIAALTHGRREQTSGVAPVASATLTGAGAPAGGRGVRPFTDASASAPAGEDAIALALAELDQPTPAAAAPSASAAHAAPASEPALAAPKTSAAPRPDSTEAFLAVLAGGTASAPSAPVPAAPATAEPASPSDTIARLAPLAGASASAAPATDSPAAEAPATASSAGDTAAFIALLGAQGPSATSPTNDDDPRPPHGGAPAPAALAEGDALSGVSKADMPASAPSVTRDASGLDAWSAEPVPPSAEEGADPLADACDWRAIALAELTADDPQPQAGEEAGERTVSQTLPRAASAASTTRAEYVAPVVGPAPEPRFVSALRESGRLEEVQEALLQAVSAHAAAKAQGPATLDALPEVEPAGTPAAPEPTSAFAPQAPMAGEDLTQAAASPAFVPTARHFASEAAQRAQAFAPAPATPVDDGWDDGFDEEFSAFASTSGVPHIQRGQAARVPAGVSCVVPDVGNDEFCDDPAVAWPAPAPTSGFGYAPVSPAQRLHASLAPSAADFAARSARQTPAYAWPQTPAYAAPSYGYGYAPVSPQQPAYAYAAPAPAAWGQPQSQPCAWPQAQPQAYAPAYAASQTPLASFVPPVRTVGEQLPATDAVTYADDVYRTDTLSPEYINYLVDDEFAHRHDSPAQRAAAAGRMHVVMGSGDPARAAGRKSGAKHFA